jgi:hypothetical protein
LLDDVGIADTRNLLLLLLSVYNELLNTRTAGNCQLLTAYCFYAMLKPPPFVGTGSHPVVRYLSVVGDLKYAHT